MNFFLRAFLLLAFLVASPFLLEAALSAYERSEPETAPGALSADGSFLVEGLNRRFFFEPHYRSVGMAVRFEQDAASRAGAVPAEMKGRLRLLSLSTILPPEPGPRPPESAMEELAFNFVLRPPEARRLAQADADKAPLVWAPEPETDADREAIGKLARFSFPPDRTFEFDVDLRSPPAPGLRAVFTYSKGTRSILRGSFLEPVAGAFMDIAP